MQLISSVSLAIILLTALCSNAQVMKVKRKGVQPVNVTKPVRGSAYSLEQFNGKWQESSRRDRTNNTQVDFEDYDHFYFYNAFYENVANAEKIDDNVAYSIERYNYYNYYLFKQLQKMPSGTRVATYYGIDEVMPPGYHVGGSDLGDLLKYWVRE